MREQAGGRVHVVGVHDVDHRRGAGHHDRRVTLDDGDHAVEHPVHARRLAGDHADRERGPLPAVPEADLGDADLQPVAQRRLRAVEHRALALERGDARQVHVDAHGADVHPTRIVGRAHTRSTSTVS